MLEVIRQGLCHSGKGKRPAREKGYLQTCAQKCPASACYFNWFICPRAYRRKCGTRECFGILGMGQLFFMRVL